MALDRLGLLVLRQAAVAAAVSSPMAAQALRAPAERVARTVPCPAALVRLQLLIHPVMAEAEAVAPRRLEPLSPGLPEVLVVAEQEVAAVVTLGLLSLVPLVLLAMLHQARHTVLMARRSQD